MRQADIDGLRIDRRSALRDVAYGIAVRDVDNDRVDYRCAGRAVVVIVAVNILPCLCPAVILVQFKRPPGGFAVRIQGSRHAIRPQVIIIAIVIPVDMAGNVTDCRCVVQMDSAALHCAGIAALLKLLPEVLVDIDQIGDLLTVFIQRQAGNTICPRVIPAGCDSIGLDKGLLAADLLIQIDLDAARPLTVAVLIVMPARVDIYRALIRAVCQLHIGISGLLQVVRGFAGCSLVAGSIADDFFLLAVGGGDISAIQRSFNSFFCRNSVDDLLALLTVAVYGQVVESILPCVYSHIAAEELRILRAIQLHAVCIELHNDRAGSDVIIVLIVRPFDRAGYALYIAVMRYHNVQLIAGRRIAVRALRDMRVQIARDRGAVDDPLPAVEHRQIRELVRPSIVVCAARNISGSDQNFLPAVGLVVPLVRSERYGDGFRPQVIAVALIVPLHSDRLVGQLNVTGNDCAGGVANSRIGAVEILGRVSVFVIRRCLIVIRHCNSIVNGLSVRIFLIVLEGIRPDVAVFTHVAVGRRDTDDAGAAVMQRVICDFEAVCVQYQCYRARAHAVVIRLVIPLDRKLHVIAGGNQVMVKADRTGIFRRRCTGRIGIDRVAVHRAGGVVIIRRRRTDQLATGCGRVFDLPVGAVRIGVTDHKHLIGDLLNRAVRRGDRQIRKGDRLLVCAGHIDGLLCYHAVSHRRQQTELDALRPATVVVGKVVPADRGDIIRGLLLPNCIQVQFPVSSIRRDIVAVAALMVGQHRAGQVADGIRLSAVLGFPADKILAVGVLHRVEGCEHIAVVIFLRGYKGCTLPRVIVVDNNLLRQPRCKECLVALYLCTRCQRYSTVGIEIPAAERIALTGWLRNRRDDHFIVLLLRGSRCLTAIRIPRQGIVDCFPYTIDRVIIAGRQPRICDVRRGRVRCGRPAQEAIACAVRVFRELERQRGGISLRLAIYRYRPCKLACCAVDRCHARSFEVVVEVTDVHIPFTNRRYVWIRHIEFPLGVIDIVVRPWDFYL